jgi:hypothetical protein
MTSRRLKGLLEKIRYDWHFRFVEIYRRGGTYFDEEVKEVQDFIQLYTSWEHVCSISQSDSIIQREQNYEELYSRYLGWDECRDILYQYEWYYLIIKDDKIQYGNEDNDEWIDRELWFEDIEG